MLNEEETRELRRRQRSRSRATAILLGALVILFFAITIAKQAAGG